MPSQSQVSAKDNKICQAIGWLFGYKGSHGIMNYEREKAFPEVMEVLPDDNG